MKKIILALLFLSVGSLLLSSPALSFTFDFTLGGKDCTGAFDSNIGMGLGMRVQDQDPDIVNNDFWAEGDDGNLNYDKGDLWTGYLKGNHELLLRLPDNLTFFARGQWKLDPAADDTRRTDLNSDAKRLAVHSVELLDLFASKRFQLGNQTAVIKVGNQVISWGEALFWIGGVSNNVLDFMKYAQPGVQMKEAFLPVPAIDFLVTLPNNQTLELYDQANFRPQRFAPPGTYLSAADSYPRYLENGLWYDYPIEWYRPNQEPDDWGFDEFGVRWGWMPSNTLMNINLYAMNYHETIPVLNAFDDYTYQWELVENHQMYGASLNIPIKNWAWGFEYSYRPNAIIDLSYPLDGVPAGVEVPMWMEGDKHQLMATGMLNLTPSIHGWALKMLGAQTAYLSMEVAAQYYPDVSDDVITRNIGGETVRQVVDGAYYITPNGEPIGDKFAWIYGIDFRWVYDSGVIIPGFTVTPVVFLGHSVKGDGLDYGGQFEEGNMQALFQILVDQNPAKWQFALTYSTWFTSGAEDDRAVRQFYIDRDFVGLSVSYSF